MQISRTKLRPLKDLKDTNEDNSDRETNDTRMKQDRIRFATTILRKLEDYRHKRHGPDVEGKGKLSKEIQSGHDAVRGFLSDNDQCSMFLRIAAKALADFGCQFVLQKALRDHVDNKGGLTIEFLVSIAVVLQQAEGVLDEVLVRDLIVLLGSSIHFVRESSILKGANGNHGLGYPRLLEAFEIQLKKRN